MYEGTDVFVDGTKVEVHIYGKLIAAASSFKYLGVVLDSTCSQNAHATSRSNGFDRAAHLLIAGLSRIPAFPHTFMLYLWSSLVVPVAGYGMELFDQPQSLWNNSVLKSVSGGDDYY